MDSEIPDLEISVRHQAVWEVAEGSAMDQKIYGALVKVKGNFDLWTLHYASEPAGWPDESIEIWSVNQTLHPKSLSEYGIGGHTDPALNQRLERAITNYLFQEAGGGLEKWTRDKWEESQLGIVDEETVSLARAASSHFPELEEKFKKIPQP